MNINQVEMAALFQSRRGIISQVECGSRDLTRTRMEVLKGLVVERPVAEDKVLVAPDEQTREMRRWRGFNRLMVLV